MKRRVPQFPLKEPGPKTSTLLRRNGYHDSRNLWNWTGRFVRELDCRGMRASMASSLLVCSPVESIVGRFALLPPRKKKMFVITPARPQLRKRDFAPACVAGQNARPG